MAFHYQEHMTSTDEFLLEYSMQFFHELIYYVSMKCTVNVHVLVVRYI